MEEAGRPPIIVGLVGAAGTNLTPVTKTLVAELKRCGYKTTRIHLSENLAEFGNGGKRLLGRPIRKPFDQRMLDLQTAGDALRQRTGANDAMAMLAIRDILPYIEAGRAFLVRSFKTKEEVQTMRRVFGRGFLLVAAYSPMGIRQATMEKDIAKSRGTRPYAVGGRYKAVAEEILRRDEKETIPYGQNVRHAFPLADVFIDASKPAPMGRQLRRFIDLAFRCPNETPTKEEQAMFLAHTAKLRSSSLHRQVGAALVTSEGDVVAIGCNDVPKAFGGLYWPDDPNDQRDFVLKRDLSQEQKIEMIHEVLRRLADEGMLEPKTAKRVAAGGANLAKHTLDLLRKTRAADLIEFFRTTHAEMEAILSAARRGIPVRDAILFTTTFPCHECTRHIVTAGIPRVVFIDPYEKSLGRALHFDAIVVDQPHVTNQVRFDPFVGVGPRVYRELFDWRRKDGAAPDEAFDPMKETPVLYVDIDRENLVLGRQRLAMKARVAEFLAKLKAAGLVTRAEERHIHSTSKRLFQ